MGLVSLMPMRGLASLNEDYQTTMERALEWPPEPSSKEVRAIASNPDLLAPSLLRPDLEYQRRYVDFDDARVGRLRRLRDWDSFFEHIRMSPAPLPKHLRLALLNQYSVSDVMRGLQEVLAFEENLPVQFKSLNEHQSTSIRKVFRDQHLQTALLERTAAVKQRRCQALFVNSWN